MPAGHNMQHFYYDAAYWAFQKEQLCQLDVAKIAKERTRRIQGEKKQRQEHHAYAETLRSHCLDQSYVKPSARAFKANERQQAERVGATQRVAASRSRRIAGNSQPTQDQADEDADVFEITDPIIWPGDSAPPEAAPILQYQTAPRLWNTHPLPANMRPQPRRAGPEIVHSVSSSSDEDGDVDVDHVVALAGAFDVLDLHGCRQWGSDIVGVFLRRCHFHLFTLNFNTFYKSFVRSDGDMGSDVRTWFVYAAVHAESEAEFWHAFKAIYKFVEQAETTGRFRPAAQMQLLSWLDARRLDYKTCCRFIIYGVVDDIENTTNAAESAHHRLKSDISVNNKAEMRMVARSDLKNVTQLYLEHEHNHQSRVLEVSLSNIPIEFCARSHLCKRAADDVLAAFLQSGHYKVSACDNGEDGCALVWREFPDDSNSKLPFRFNRGPRVLQLNDDKITCPCPTFIATQRVCAHIMAFNEGNFGPEDVHPRHLKAYFELDALPNCSTFLGCVNRRPADAVFHPLPASDNADNGDLDVGGDLGGERVTGVQPAVLPRPGHGRLYSILTQKSREVIEKWSHIPIVASKLMALLTAFDSDMGDVADYRVGGEATSAPTRSRGDYR